MVLMGNTKNIKSLIFNILDLQKKKNLLRLNFKRRGLKNSVKMNLN